MSKMSDLAYEVEQLYIEGHSAKMIADLLDCPVEQVLGYIQDMGVQDAPEDYSPFVSMNS
jgi:DNA-binding CsgD family transcriptional regulator